MKFDRKTADNLAEEVLSRFKDGITPNEAIKEAAVINDLNIEQIKRVCESSNVKIKKHLSKEASNPSFTFPLADWRDVISDFQPVVTGEPVEKTASVYMCDEWEEFEELISDGMEKDAEALATTPFDSMDLLADAAIHIESTNKDLRREQAKHAHDLHKISERLIGTIQDCYNRHQSIDTLYTIALNKTASTQHNVVNTLFSEAKERYENAHGASLPDYSTIKLAGVINHNSQFVKTLRKYIITRDKLIKTAQSRLKTSRAKAKITNRLHSLMLGD